MHLGIGNAAGGSKRQGTCAMASTIAILLLKGLNLFVSFGGCLS